MLTTLGQTRRLQGERAEGQHSAERSDVTVANVKTPTPFGFGGWVAMTKGTGGMDVMMGDLVLTQDEVNPVMSALLDNGLEVTALHNHFFWDEPRMFYMHVHGHGTPADLARKVKPALDLIGKGAGGAGAAPPPRRARDRRSIPRRLRRSSATGRADGRGLQDHHRPRRSEAHRDGRADQRAHGSEHLGGLRRHE